MSRSVQSPSSVHIDVAFLHQTSVLTGLQFVNHMYVQFASGGFTVARKLLIPLAAPINKHHASISLSSMPLVLVHISTVVLQHPLSKKLPFLSRSPNQL